ncbi:unnamed protein product [Ceutorhynchus assimilis]|uniref:SAM domain-containing protein n=1 Tax=Ceutorhynchus assimilis TaxID=467358 RepID=A0A9N9QMG4_9CUCU|nr:unnamed protein product [Ceutorhynchus assimilis]
MNEEEKINTLNDTIVKALTTGQDKHSPATKKDERISEETKELMRERRNKRSEEATTEEEFSLLFFWCTMEEQISGVATWLKMCNLEHLWPIFEENKINDMEIVNQLTAEEIILIT